MPSSVSRQLKAYPKRPFCILSLSHAVLCLATAEGIPYASALHPLSLSHAVRCLATAEGIPYASALHPLSLSHAVRCLAIAESIPYVSAFSHMPSSVLATDKGIPYEPIRPPLAPLIDFARGVLAPPRRSRAGSLRAAGQCSLKNGNRNK
jgi:hypothetical protein